MSPPKNSPMRPSALCQKHFPSTKGTLWVGEHFQNQETQLALRSFIKSSGKSNIFKFKILTGKTKSKLVLNRMSLYVSKVLKNSIKAMV